jgi:voltage-gated potassium channel
MGDRDPAPASGDPKAERARRRARRRLFTLTLLRSALVVVVLVVTYYLLPLDQPISALTGFEFGVGLMVLAGAGYWQVRAVMDSDTPRLRAVQAIAVGLPLLLLLFACTYVLLANSTAHSFTEPISRTDALYFTVTVFATVGFGDIAPVTEVARIITMIQMLIGITAVGIVAKVLLGAVEVAVQRRDAPATGSGSDGPAPGPDATGPGGSVGSE